MARSGLYSESTKVIKEKVSNLSVDAVVLVGGRHLHEEHHIEDNN